MDPYLVNMEAALLSDKAFSQNWAKGANVLVMVDLLFT
jgi:hypothetical protein